MTGNYTWRHRVHIWRQYSSTFKGRNEFRFTVSEHAYVSVICLALTRHTGQVCTSAALAAVFWSAPWDFFFSAAFLAFFCWDWIFCCPRAIALSFDLPDKTKQDIYRAQTLLKRLNWNRQNHKEETFLPEMVVFHLKASVRTQRMSLLWRRTKI